MSSRVAGTAGILIATLLAFQAPAGATWSIAAVDPETGQVGLAAASCTYSVHGVGHVLPGKGVVVVQAMSNGEARSRGVELMREGADNPRILEAMRDARFDPENQQYAVVQLDGGLPLNHAGTSNSDWNGGLTATNVTVQGNTLTDEGVVTAALEKFQSSSKRDLLERLVAALAAGAAAGGDRRCGEQRATSAFVTVAGPDDHESLPHFQVVVLGIDTGGEPAVARLQKEVKKIRRSSRGQKSTLLFVVP